MQNLEERHPGNLLWQQDALSRLFHRSFFGGEGALQNQTAKKRAHSFFLWTSKSLGQRPMPGDQKKEGQIMFVEFSHMIELGF